MKMSNFLLHRATRSKGNPRVHGTISAAILNVTCSKKESYSKAAVETGGKVVAAEMDCYKTRIL